MYKLNTFFMETQPFKALREYRLIKDSEFYVENRKTVLQSYRYLLKTIPKLYDRGLQQRAMYQEIKYLFKESKTLLTIHETRLRNEHLQQMTNDIQKGDLSNIGTWIPGREGQRNFLMMQWKHYNHDY